MPRLHLPLCLAALCAVSALPQAQAQAKASGRQVILISVDGMTPAEYLHRDEHHLAIPNLRALIANGCPANGMTGVFPASTYISHTSMITGQPPSVHGIVANTPLDPFGLENGGWYYYADKIQSPTLWQDLRDAHVKTAAVSWPVTVGAPIDFLLPEYRPVRTDEDRSLMRAISTPGLFREMETVDPKDRPMSDEWRIAAVLAILRTRHPGLLALHLSDLDEVQHKYGPHTPETHAVLEEIDTQIGQIRSSIAAAGKANQTAWIIVSDHGFLTISKQTHLMVALREAGLITVDKTGKITAWKVYPRNLTGSAFLEVKDPKDTESIAKATALMQKLAADPADGIARIDTIDDLKRMQANPGAFLAVEPVKGFGFGNNMTGPLVTDAPGKGAHGYDPAIQEMRPSMIMSGAGVQPCKLLEDVSITDVGPTAAALLGVKMPGTPGRNVNVPHKQ